MYAIPVTMLLIGLIMVAVLSIINPSLVKTENRSIDETLKDFIAENN